MPPELLRQSFSLADQHRFARLSGDHNPIHVDPLAARRTAGGKPVVHGLHLLLRGMDALAASLPSLPPPDRIQAKFNKPVLLGDSVAFVLAANRPPPARCACRSMARPSRG